MKVCRLNYKVGRSLDYNSILFISSYMLILYHWATVSLLSLPYWDPVLDVVVRFFLFNLCALLNTKQFPYSAFWMTVKFLREIKRKKIESINNKVICNNPITHVHNSLNQSKNSIKYLWTNRCLYVVYIFAKVPGHIDWNIAELM